MALWHIVHMDDDQEDLEEHEVKEAVAALKRLVGQKVLHNRYLSGLAD